MLRTKKFDIVVVGGGFSGVAAAIAAARQEKKVLLIEKFNALGGAANSCLVNPFMPYYTREKDSRPLSAGIFAEIRERIKTLQKKYDYDYVGPGFNEEFLKIALNQMCKEAKVNLLFDTTVIKARKKDGVITSLDCFSQGNVFRVSGKVFIDATGDGNLAYMAGCPFRVGREDGLCQPMTLCFRVNHYDKEVVKQTQEQMQENYKAACQKGKIKNPREDVLWFIMPDGDVCHLNSTRVVKLDPTNPYDLSKAEVIAREQTLELFDFLKKQKGFEKATLLSTAQQIGIRESRMIEGEFLLTQEDMVEQRRFEDSIACGNYDIDIHNPEGSGTSHYFFENGAYYHIPYRCLLPQDCNNLIVVGRCISVTHEAQASMRIMPIVCCVGEAGGLAASLAVEEGTTKVNIAKLHALLDESGAVYR